MNERFFSLPKEKQEKIIQSGYRVFSQHAYKNAPMLEIAQEACISKSLLFHYFQNKKEFYLFLWDRCAQITIEFLGNYGCYDQDDFFDALELGMQGKLHLIEQYPDMCRFTIRAFYEKEPEISQAIQKSYHHYFNWKADRFRLKIDPEQFVEGVDLQMMYREMYLASEGYLWEMVQQGDVEIERLEKEFKRLIGFWKGIYKRRENEDECDPDRASR